MDHLTVEHSKDWAFARRTIVGSAYLASLECVSTDYPDAPLQMATEHIDTQFGSPKSHYVNRPVREIRPPSRWRFSSPHFGPP